MSLEINDLTKILQEFELKVRNSGAPVNFLRQSSAYSKVSLSERREPRIWLPPLTGREMSAMTPRRIALVVLASAGLLVLAVMLLARRDQPGSIGLAAVGPVGALIM